MTTSIPRSSKTRPLTIIAQDPSVEDQSGKPITASVNVPAEELAPGPCGYRVRVIDYDASTGTLYRPLMDANISASYIDPFENKSIEELLASPQFHQQNVYAIAMRTLGRFEFALGRRVSWQFTTHQLKIVPHAFREANAFYSRDHEALLFGYYASRKATNSEKGDRGTSTKRTYTCLSHDIVAHETTHALLDGVRQRFIYPSLTDQAAFHEGFSDLVAILSVISVTDLVKAIIIKSNEGERELIIHNKEIDDPKINSAESLEAEIMRISPLLSLAEEMGKNSHYSENKALRESLKIKPDRTALTKPEFQSPHRRGELLVAAVLRSVIKIAKKRAIGIGVPVGDSQIKLSVQQMAESYAKAAENILTICIRGLDYVSPVHVSFASFLAGILTADFELIGNDSRYGYREVILESFGEYGISSQSECENGLWSQQNENRWLKSERTDHRAMMFNPDEMFRYVWENREPLRLSDNYYTRVTAVNPTMRVGPDGMIVSETVVEYIQSACIRGSKLSRHGLRRPLSMPSNAEVVLFGGGTLIFDVRGKLKYHIRYDINDPRQQNQVLQHFADQGVFSHPQRAGVSRTSFANLHEARSVRISKVSGEELWQ